MGWCRVCTWTLESATTWFWTPRAWAWTNDICARGVGDVCTYIVCNTTLQLLFSAGKGTSKSYFWVVALGSWSAGPLQDNCYRRQERHGGNTFWAKFRRYFRIDRFGAIQSAETNRLNGNLSSLSPEEYLVLTLLWRRSLVPR